MSETTSRPAESPTGEMRVEHIVVQRTARYVVMGEPSAKTRELWVALHGYGQLAADFAHAMAPVASAERLVIVPEGLSRFYLESPVRGTHMTARVGATWMTREDRDAEIVDQIAYLDALRDHVIAMLAPRTPMLRVLGFSQGVATAARWLTRGRSRADHVILWAGQLPDDVAPADLVDPTLGTRLTFVLGARDDVLPPDGLARTTERLEQSGAPFDRMTFEGGHRLDRGVLLRLAER